MNTKLVLPPPKFDSYSDFGGVGLLQMPTARFAPEGELAVSTSLVEPYQRTAITLQAFPWLEANLRYTAVRNRLYGPANFSGDQNLKDKGIDIKVRLLEESKHWPQLALGLRDIGGTGLFSSEYLVMNKRYFDFDFSLGLGWGNIGTRGHFKNPFASLADRFKTRQNNVGQGGTVSTGNFFAGERIALFGGLTYQTPINGLSLKLEYDGNNYQSEAHDNPQPVRSPFNFGAVYSYNDWLDVSIGYERGNQLMAQISLHTNIHKTRGMPKFDAEPDRIKPRDIRADIREYQQKIEKKTPNKTSLLDSNTLNELGFQVDSVAFRGKEMIATVSQSSFRNKAKAVGRIARAMANTAPADIEVLTIIDRQAGLDTQRISLMRKDLENAVSYKTSPDEIATNLTVSPITDANVAEQFVNQSNYPSLTWGWTPAMRHHIGGPDDPYFYQIYLRTFADWQLTKNFTLSGEIGINLTNNFEDLKLPSDSVLPHVRSDIKDYLKEGANGITMLQADYLAKIGSNTYARLSAGLFEDMFGGVGGEILFKPFGKRWAVGADLNRVRQREYDKRFSFRNYEITTGHMDFYYQLPYYNITAQLSLGQYLAGDRGATLAFSRRFESGAEVGVFATRTNVSAEDFGEGSFDKGIFVTIPFDFLSLYSNRNSIGVGWRPLTRDGGQKLIQAKRLYPIVSDTGHQALISGWSEVLK